MVEDIMTASYNKCWQMFNSCVYIYIYIYIYILYIIYTIYIYIYIYFTI